MTLKKKVMALKFLTEMRQVKLNDPNLIIKNPDILSKISNPLCPFKANFMEAPFLQKLENSFLPFTPITKALVNITYEVIASNRENLVLNVF